MLVWSFPLCPQLSAYAKIRKQEMPSWARSSVYLPSNFQQERAPLQNTQSWILQRVSIMAWLRSAVCCLATISFGSINGSRTPSSVLAFHFHVNFRESQRPSKGTALGVSASELLYQDQQQAMLRRANVELELLQSKKAPKALEAPKLKLQPPKSGTGFANTAVMNKATRLAAEQAKVIQRDGVIRIDSAMSPEVADRLRQYLLDQQREAQTVTEQDPTKSKLYYGVEQARKNRCDMHLSLLRGGVNAGGTDVGEHVLADALQEVLGKDGSLRALYQNLVTGQGEFYELAGIITNPGSYRQMIHPDLPYQKEAPLYVVFLALQDVTTEMGPTWFLLKTNTAKAIDIFDRGDMEAKDEQLKNADCRMATLRKGDAVLFDARVLHCGGANDEQLGGTRVMLNFSFRNPKVKGDMGYKGSMMPGYVGAMTLDDVSKALDSYREGNVDPFSQYGNGLSQR